MKYTSIILCLFASLQLNAQIFLDGYTFEWSEDIIISDDTNDGGSGIELLELEIDDDNEKLYFRIKLENEINLTESNDLFLYIDFDDNPSTGFALQNIGADLVWDFGENDGNFYLGGNSFNVYWPDLGMRVLPTHESNEFELSFEKDAEVNGNTIISASTIKVLLRDNSGLDQIPNLGSTFSYDFTNDIQTEYAQSLNKDEDFLIRLLSWNTKFDGILEMYRRQEFAEIISAMNPDIIALQETWEMTESEAIEFIEEIGFVNWSVHKNGGNNIILSKYPISESHDILAGERLQAVKIDLPDPNYQRDLIVINAHLSCCGNDAGRQLQSDAIANFIQELKSGTGPFPVEGNTPFLICGDMNFVGESTQLNTLLTGDIINESQFDLEGPMDWNNEDLENLLCYQTDSRSTVTWRNESSSFLPGKLDYFIYSSSVMDIPKSFVIQTETMPNDRLELYGLNISSTSIASDHFPMVADLELPYVPSSVEDFEASEIISPNPFQSEFSIQLENSVTVPYNIYTLEGQEIAQGQISSGAEQVNAINLSPGVYLLRIDDRFHRIVKME